ncbi:MAG: sodium:calcium antiporter [Rhodothermaceae bacterium]|nr:MAG: sodium:calcium antiporter [Bacteroidota bacterium]GIV61422.1 MAG: sodium:calcium antiporter [Rhodothermaceae bacterium]
MTVLLILSGLVLLVLGAEGLVRGSVGLALRLGLTPLVIGLTVVAFGTGSPELVVSLRAALDGESGLALGNVVGSNIANIALILGLSALIRPMNVQLQVIRREIPIMIGATLLLGQFLLNGHVGRLEGAMLVLGIIAYTGVTYRLARQETKETPFDEEMPATPAQPVWVSLLLAILGLGGLLLGARLFVAGAVTLAETLGVSRAVIGLSVVAVGTSLPELATSVVAAIRREGDVAIGNVVGSNIFNILAILGVTALVQPIPALDLRPLDFGAMLLVSLIILPLMHSGFRLNRLEGGLLLIGYAAYLYTLWP